MSPLPLHRQKSFWLCLLLAVAMLGALALLPSKRRLPPALQSLVEKDQLREKIRNSFNAEWRRIGETSHPSLGSLDLPRPGEAPKFLLTGCDAETLAKVKPVLARVLSRHQIESVSLKTLVERGDGFVNEVDEIVKAQP